MSKKQIIHHIRIPNSACRSVLALKEKSTFLVLFGLIQAIKRSDPYALKGIVLHQEIKNTVNVKSSTTIQKAIKSLVHLGLIQINLQTVKRLNGDVYSAYKIELLWDNPKKNYVSFSEDEMKKAKTLTPGEFIVYFTVKRHALYKGVEQKNGDRFEKVVDLPYWGIMNFSQSNVARSKIKEASKKLHKAKLFKYISPYSNGNNLGTYVVAEIFKSSVVTMTAKEWTKDNDQKPYYLAQLPAIEKLMVKLKRPPEEALDWVSYFTENPRAINPNGKRGDTVRYIPAVIQKDHQSGLRIIHSRFGEWQHQQVKKEFKELLSDSEDQEERSCAAKDEDSVLEAEFSLDELLKVSLLAMEGRDKAPRPMIRTAKEATFTIF